MTGPSADFPIPIKNKFRSTHMRELTDEEYASFLKKAEEVKKERFLSPLGLVLPAKEQEIRSCQSKKVCLWVAKMELIRKHLLPGDYIHFTTREQGIELTDAVRENLFSIRETKNLNDEYMVFLLVISKKKYSDLDIMKCFLRPDDYQGRLNKIEQDMMAAQEETFGEHLKRLRLEAGLTQQELGAKVGVKHAAISSWELGRTEPQLKLFSPLAKALGVSVSDLLDTKEEKDG